VVNVSVGKGCCLYYQGLTLAIGATFRLQNIEHLRSRMRPEHYIDKGPVDIQGDSILGTLGSCVEYLSGIGHVEKRKVGRKNLNFRS